MPVGGVLWEGVAVAVLEAAPVGTKAPLLVLGLALPLECIALAPDNPASSAALTAVVAAAAPVTVGLSTSAQAGACATACALRMPWPAQQSREACSELSDPDEIDKMGNGLDCCSI